MDSLVPSTRCSATSKCDQMNRYVYIDEDFTDLFETQEWFQSREELVSWVRAIGKENQMVLVVKRSDNGGGSKRGRIFLGCERGGLYREFKGKKNRSKEVDPEKKVVKKKVNRREKTSKKCGCPFMLKGVEIELNGPWALEVLSGFHNHSIENYLEGHAYVGRLTMEEEEYVIEMSMQNVRPKNMLKLLKTKFPSNKSTIRCLYNYRQKYRLGNRAGKSQMKYLMDKLEEHKYYFLPRQCGASGKVRDLFFAHPRSIDLLRAFPQVLLIDCTYKTMYKLPLMEIVGVTSTGLTFCVAIVYMDKEKEDNYIWACRTLKDLMDESCLPSLIVTDREEDLMNAIGSVFPSCRHFICRWHINKNITTNCRKNFSTNDKWEEFMHTWNLLVLADNVVLFEQRLQRLREEFNFAPEAIEYVIKQWVDPYKDRFVSFNTNSIKHYGNTTTIRAEGQHSALKRQLQTSQCNFEQCWGEFHMLMEASHTEIKQSFEKSINLVQHKFGVTTYRELRGLVSSVALQLIDDEILRLGKGVLDASLCGCETRDTLGLPCAHELSEYISKGLPIPLEMIDDFWRKLDMEPHNIERHKRAMLDKLWNALFNEANQKYGELDYTKAELMYRRVHEAVNPTTTSLHEPEAAIHTKDRPKYSKNKVSLKKRDLSTFELPLTEIDSSFPTTTVVYDTDTTVLTPHKKRPAKESAP